jgi:DNA recombination protein RmuC
MESICIILILAIGGVGIYFFLSQKKKYDNLKEQYQELQKSNIRLEVENKNSIEKLEILNRENEELDKKTLQLEKRCEQLSTKLEEERKRYEEKLESAKEIEYNLKESFENIANKIIHNSNQSLLSNSKENLKTILEPLHKDIELFRSRLENINKEEAQKIALLENELNNLKNLSLKLSDDAQNLTKALKGDKKLQGNWGELVLERILEMSGLRKGIEYKREETLKDNENNSYRPDVIIYLPNERNIIIDAKTSLNAYEEYIKTEEEKYIKTHIKSIKNHIDKLAQKKYENLKGINSLDFVFMFVPIENALMLALENDNTLFEYAFKQRVVLVSPTTLLASLRAIESSWRFEKQAKNIEEVVRVAENLYDKVRGFSEEFEKIEKALDNAKKSFDNAKSRLTSGRGNVIRQIEILKEKAGIKPKREIKELK